LHKVFRFTWLFKDARLSIVCYYQSRGRNHAVPNPHGAKLLSHGVKLFLFFVYTGRQVLIKSHRAVLEKNL
ncbi:hypothetical protein M9458_048401, partial [Cirrhinus mrigala]